MSTRLSPTSTSKPGASTRARAAAAPSRPKKPRKLEAAEPVDSVASGRRAAGQKSAWSAASPSLGPSVTAFLLAPELKAAEWLAAAGAKPKPESTLQDGLTQLGNAFYHRLKEQPAAAELMRVFHENPAGLRARTDRLDKVGLEFLHFARIAAARNYFELPLDSDTIFWRAGCFSVESRREWETAARNSPDGALLQRDLDTYIEGSERLKKAYCGYFGQRDFWKTRSLTEHELFRLLSLHHPPQSPEAALLAAIRAVADKDKTLSYSFSNHNLDYVSRRAAALQQRLDFVDRLESQLVAGKKKS